jgi:hypothetical protein
MVIGQAYIEGFVKRASEYGLNQNEAVQLLKAAADVAHYPKVIGAKRLLAAGAGITGATLGGIGGAAYGLLSPGEEMDPETKKMVQKSRLKAMLQNAGYGTVLGGGIGAGAGAAFGLAMKRRFPLLAKDLFPGRYTVRVDELVDRVREVYPERFKYI